jgi:hypothetical protein
MPNFAVILLSGRYALEQQGREVFLKPGDITFYDATRPHRIHCPGSFSKLIVSIPRMTLRDRIAGMEHCTALPISGRQGIGAVASQFIRATANQSCRLGDAEFRVLADHWLDLLTLAVTSVRPQNFFSVPQPNALAPSGQGLRRVPSGRLTVGCRDRGQRRGLVFSLRQRVVPGGRDVPNAPRLAAPIGAMSPRSDGSRPVRLQSIRDCIPLGFQRLVAFQSSIQTALI